MTAAAATGTGWYVYGVVDPGEAGALDEPARLVAHGGLAAVVAPVDLSEFGEPALTRNLEDRAWLEQRAREHEAVLERVAARGAVVPLRFGAIYRDLDDVRAFLEERREQLAEALRRVRGRVELGVKGWLDRSRLEEELARGRGTPRGSSSGRAYLERRRAERDVAAEAGTVALRAAQDAHERLLASAVAGVVNRPQSPELSGRAEQMVLNAAYLVPAGDASLRQTVEALNREGAATGLSFELTGPWPPYNFVEPEDA